MLNFSNTKHDAKEDSMPFEVQTAADGVKLILLGRLGVQQARPLWNALQPAIAAGQSIRVQAEKLDEMDTSIVQVLLRLSTRKDQFQIGETSDGFYAALKGRGLQDFLVQLPVELEAKIPQLLPPETLAKAARQGHG
jgi:ABC-type transporter Mla MlaB component